jgi:hypothetical protein
MAGGEGVESGIERGGALRAEGCNGTALELVRRALVVHPQNGGLKQDVDKLARQVEIDPI